LKEVFEEDDEDDAEDVEPDDECEIGLFFSGVMK
jgi:hypothetical protein